MILKLTLIITSSIFFKILRIAFMAPSSVLSSRTSLQFDEKSANVNKKYLLINFVGSSYGLAICN